MGAGMLAAQNARMAAGDYQALLGPLLHDNAAVADGEGGELPVCGAANVTNAALPHARGSCVIAQ